MTTEAQPGGPVAARQASWAGRFGATRVVALIFVLGLLAVWWDARTELATLRADVATRLRDNQEVVRLAQAGARDSQDRVRETLVKVAALEARLAESQSQQAALESMYQDLSRNRDEWALAEIEQTLILAAQQLQLAGNVRGALLALQNADARLGRADRAQFIAVRRVLQRDIERLKALPQVDTAGIAIRLDAIIAGIDSLPLLFDERLQAAVARERERPEAGNPAGSVVPDAPLWRRMADDAWDQFRQLVRIRDIGGADPVLLNPTQSFFLRENLKLRLLNARIALLQRNEALFRQDLGAATQWMARYFDVRSRAGGNAQSALKALSASTLNMELPTLAESLNAVRNFKPQARVTGK